MIILQSLTQADDGVIDRTRRGELIPAPDAIENFRTINDRWRSRNQQFQHASIPDLQERA